MDKRLLPLIFAGLGLSPSGENRGEYTTPSHKVTMPKQQATLSKRKLQKMKGKKARKNRGRK